VSQYPLANLAPPRERKAIKVAPKILEAYVGEYQLVPGFTVTVSREGD
jgi:serine-type D-Ala-D-Ala carboxypeptidase/endopeptidase